MLAPRKKLYSTPDEVISVAYEWVQPLEGKVCDVGCGDGRVIFQWARRTTGSVEFVGVDIDESRIERAKQTLSRLVLEGEISQNVSISFYHLNALDAMHIFEDATVVFLYLIPRGLRRFVSLLMKQRTDTHSTLYLISYMNPLEHREPLRHELIRVEHQPGAAWPLYLYKLTADEQSL